MRGYWILCIGLLLCACGPKPESENTEPDPATAGPIQIQAKVGSQIFVQVCASCHGLEGEGKTEMKTPSIGGLPSWYTQAQLQKFQKGWRGYKPQDALGTQMRMIASALSAEQAEAVAGYIADLPRHPMVNTLKGDANKGKIIYEETCIACHRYNASGELMFGSPPLTSLQDWYLAEQLNKFKAGYRGNAADDENGRKMVDVVQHLLNQQEFFDVLAYVAELAKEVEEPARD